MVCRALSHQNHPLKIRRVRSPDTDPWKNLAREEFLMGDCADDEAIFYLWRNARTVVIGRNQNAWSECQLDLLESEDGRLARRSSGGGAVFHDLGNLNFSFIVPRRLFSMERQLGVVLGALRSLGIDAEFSGRNDLAIGGRKFSGNAWQLTRDRGLHHGTLLLSADMSMMSRYLNVDPEKLKAEGVTVAVAMSPQGAARLAPLAAQAGAVVKLLHLDAPRAVGDEHLGPDGVAVDGRGPVEPQGKPVAARVAIAQRVAEQLVPLVVIANDEVEIAVGVVVGGADADGLAGVGRAAGLGQIGEGAVAVVDRGFKAVDAVSARSVNHQAIRLVTTQHFLGSLDIPSIKLRMEPLPLLILICVTSQYQKHCHRLPLARYYRVLRVSAFRYAEYLLAQLLPGLPAR